MLPSAERKTHFSDAEASVCGRIRHILRERISAVSESCIYGLRIAHDRAGSILSFYLPVSRRQLFKHRADILQMFFFPAQS